MCNSCRIVPKRGADETLRGRVSAAAGQLKSPLVRKSDPGIVVLADERVEVMRWGFGRSFDRAVNNARSDKLESGMWKEAFRQRRCVIPASAFYEWGPGGGGRRRAHEFRDPDGDYLWIAGLWEENPEFGPCYAMITTDAPPLMASIHNRMPAVLRPDEVSGFLNPASTPKLRPFAGKLVVEPCESPLKSPNGDRGADQPELF